MVTVGSFNAKTHLPALLERVAKGETIQITKRGVPIAKLVPAGASLQRDRRKLVEEIRQLRKGIHLGRLHLQTLIKEGHRY